MRSIDFLWKTPTESKHAGVEITRTSLPTFHASLSSAANRVPRVSAPYTGASELGPSDRQNILTLRATSDSPPPARPVGPPVVSTQHPDCSVVRW